MSALLPGTYLYKKVILWYNFLKIQVRGVVI